MDKHHTRLVGRKAKLCPGQAGSRSSYSQREARTPIVCVSAYRRIDFRKIFGTDLADISETGAPAAELDFTDFNVD